VAVAGQKFDVLDRQVELVAAGIFEGEAFVRGTHRGDGLEPGIAPDAVVGMDDQVSHRQHGRVGQEVLRPPAALRPADQPVAEDVLLGDHRETRRLEPALELEDRDVHAALTEVRGAGDLLDPGDALVLQEPRHPFAGAGGIGRDDDGRALATVLDVPREGREEVGALRLPLRRKAAPGAAPRVDHARAERLRQRGELANRPGAESRTPVGLAEIEEIRRDRLVGRGAARLRRHRLDPGAVLLGERFPARGAGRLEPIVEGDRRPRQVVEDGLEPVVEERQPMLEALMLATGRHGLVERVVLTAGAEPLAIGAAEAGDRRFVEDDLRDRRELDPVDRLARALGVRIEAPGGVEDVAEEVEADRELRAGREDVDEPAPDGEVAGLGHRGRLREAHPREIGPQGVDVDAAADRRGEGGRSDGCARWYPLGRGVQRREKDGRTIEAFGEGGKRRHPRRRDLGVGRDPVVGQAIPGRKGEHRQLRRKESETGAQGCDTGVIARDVDHRPGRAGDGLGEQPRIEAFRRTRDGDAAGPEGVGGLHGAQIEGRGMPGKRITSAGRSPPGGGRAPRRRRP
jgi:hypothetical protein